MSMQCPWLLIFLFWKIGVFEQMHSFLLQQLSVYALKPPYCNTCADLNGGIFKRGEVPVSLPVSIPALWC